jgi:hypothetical protein
MIRDLDRKVALLMVRLKLWRADRNLFRTVEIKPRKGTRWLLDVMKRRQARDTAHHAPCCPANHWHYQRLVFHACNCGAVPLGVDSPDGAKHG